MERHDKIEKYKDYLCVFCKQSAYLEDVKYRVERGEAVSEEEMVSHLSLLRDSRDALLAVKDELGFDGGIDFTDDCNFYGFKYKDGMLSGDYTKLPNIILPWVKEFDEGKIYTYEVGTLILFHYMIQEERRKKERRRRRVKKVCHNILHLWKVFVLAVLGVEKEDLTYE